MRGWLALLVLAACNVPLKQPPDGGGDDPAGSIETTITDAPAAFSNSRTASFRFTSNLASARFECRVDGAAATTCTSPLALDLTDGAHGFAVRALDGGGRRDDTPAEHRWSIDTIAPNTTISDGPHAADRHRTVHFSFTSNESNVTFECSLDNAPFASCDSGDAFGPIPGGAHTFAVRARDRAGNFDFSPALYAWIRLDDAAAP